MPRDVTRRLFIALWGLAFAALAFGLVSAETEWQAGWIAALPAWAAPLALVGAAHYVVRPFQLPVLPRPPRALWAVAAAAAVVIQVLLVLNPPSYTHRDHSQCKADPALPREQMTVEEVRDWLRSFWADCVIETQRTDWFALMTSLLLAMAPLLAVAAFSAFGAWTRRPR